jgi:hypothetical protein
MISRASTGGRAVENKWFSVGASSSQNAYEAGLAAANDALDEHSDAKLLIVFCSDNYNLQELLNGINDRSGDVPLIGCSTAGEIATSGPQDASVVVTAIGGENFSVQTSIATEASRRLRQAGAEVARCFPPAENRHHKVLLMLTDGLAGDQQEIVRGAYSVVGAAIPLVGGCAGDDLKMKATFQLFGREVHGDAVVAAGIASDSALGIGVRHGWNRVGEPMLVTKSANNRVYTINDEPALDVYLRHLDPPLEAHLDEAAFTRFALTHPLGLDRPSGEYQVRFIGEANFEDRSLGCIAEVPQGGLVWFMEGDEYSVLEATDQACMDALNGLGGKKPLGVLAFDCIARKGILGDEGIGAEIRRIADHVEGSPVAGFYTYGEIARTRGVAGFHNQTLVVLALS